MVNIGRKLWKMNSFHFLESKSVESSCSQKLNAIHQGLGLIQAIMQSNAVRKKHKEKTSDNKLPLKNQIKKNIFMFVHIPSRLIMIALKERKKINVNNGQLNGLDQN